MKCYHLSPEPSRSGVLWEVEHSFHRQAVLCSRRVWDIQVCCPCTVSNCKKYLVLWCISNIKILQMKEPETRTFVQKLLWYHSCSMDKKLVTKASCSCYIISLHIIIICNIMTICWKWSQIFYTVLTHLQRITSWKWFTE